SLATTHRIFITDTGGSTLLLSGVTSLNGSNAGISITDTGGSRLALNSGLTTLVGVGITLDGTDANVANAWTKFTASGLTVTGGSYNLPALTDVDGSNLAVTTGGSLALPNLKSYSSNVTTFSADSTGSVLDVSALTTLTQQRYWSISATNGGEVKLGGLTSLATTHRIFITDTNGSTLLLSGVTSLNGSNAVISITDTGNSTLLASNLATLSGVSLTLDGTGTFSSSQITTIAGTFTLSGGTLTLSGSPNIDNATVVVQGGGTLDLPSGTTYTGVTTLDATGAGSTLTLAGTSLAESTNAGSVLLIEALAGGTATMSALTSISGGPVVLLSDGANSAINLLALQTFTSSGGALASNGGSIQSGITLPAAPDVWINPAGGSWDNGGNWIFGSSPAAGTNVVIATSAAATITLGFFDNISVKSLTLGNGDTLSVGDGAVLSATGDVTNSGSLTLAAGGQLTVGGNETQTASAAINEQIGGAPASGFFGVLAVTGTVTLAGAFNLAIVNGFSPAVGQDFPVITFASASGTFSTVSGLTGSGSAFGQTLHSTSLDLVVLPTPPTFAADSPPAAAVGSAYSYQFQANGTAPITFSAAGLPAWAALDSASGILSGTPTAVGTFNFTVTASNGTAPDATANISLAAQLEPPTFTADTPPVAVAGSAYSYQFQATGTGATAITYSASGLPAWAAINASSGVFSGTPPTDGTFDFTVTASNGIAPDTSVSASLIVAGGTAVTFNIAAGTTVTIPAAVYAGGTTFNVGAGAMVTIPGGTFTGGVIFNVAAGAVVDLTGGGTPSYAGTLTGSGSGTVQLSSGRLYLGNGGMTLNFAGGLFQWTGGQMDAGNGDLTNLGTMNISGAAEKDFYNDGVLDNFGTIIQSGTGNLQLGTDGTFPTTLKNEAGASYLIEGDGGLSEISDSGSAPGQTSLDNAGTIQKTAGSGTSSLSVLGSITNTGTIEADSGAISLAAALGISQLSGGTLTAGAWNALDGASLDFPSGTAITANAANLALGGSGATISGISGLASNSGSFALTGGATFSSSGDFSNSGSLTLGGALDVAGSFTQTSAGTLDEQIGGTPASGQFGLVAATGTAALAGTFELNLLNAFSGAVGQDFKVMTFASASGLFSEVLGFGSTFSEAVNPTSLDLYAFRSPADLQVSNVSAPTTATSGQQITVTWQVADQGPSNATGNWQDSVYLSPTSTITSNSVLLGAAQHTGGLNASSSYSGTLSATVPALAPGSYYVFVQVDSLYQVSDPNRANNTLAATTGQLAVSLPALTLGTPANGSFTAADQDQYYQVTVPAGGTLSVTLASAATSGATALYVGQGVPPTPYSYQEEAVVANQPNQTVLVPQVLTAGTYYILAHSVSGAAATAGYTLTAQQTTAVSVSAISSYAGGNAGNVTIEIDGENFTRGATASLTLAAATLNATAIDFVNASQLFATFNLVGAAAGAYTLSVQQGAQSATAPTTFHVVAANPVSDPLAVTLDAPQSVRTGRTGTVVISYTNTGNNDLGAPLLTLFSPTNTAMGLGLSANDVNAQPYITLLGLAADGPLGTLRPGAANTLTVFFRADLNAGTPYNFQLQVTEPNDPTPLDYQNTVLPWIFPSYTSLPNWSAIYANLQQRIGGTMGDFVQMLDRNATLMVPNMAGDNSNMQQLLNLEVRRAEAAVGTSITGVVQAPDPTVTIAGQVVYATNTSTQTVFDAKTMTDGSFILPNVDPGGYQLSFSDGLVTSGGAVTVAGGQAVTNVVLQVAPGAQIAGQVTLAVSNAAVSDADVIAYGAGGSEYTTTTDANGNYSLAGLPADTYTLIVEATGLARNTVSNISVTTGETVEDVTLPVESVIQGTITTPLSLPSTAVLTVIVNPSGNTDPNLEFSNQFTAPTDFSVAGLPAGTYDVTLDLTGYVPQTITSQTVAAQATLNLGTIAMVPFGSVSGTVASNDAQVPAANVEVGAYDASGDLVASAAADGSGNFNISGLPPGSYSVTTVDTGGFVAPVPVSLTAGQALTNEALTIEPGGGIQGTVTDSKTSTPLAGIPVYLHDSSGNLQTTITDSNGNYQFSGLALDTYQVNLQSGAADVGSSASVTVTTLNGPALTANLVLTTVGTLGGKVTDGAGGPIAGATVRLYDSGTNTLVGITDTASDGSYGFVALQAGTFDLQASAVGATFSQISGVSLTTGANVTQDIAAGTGTLQVTVVDDVQTVTGASVALFYKTSHGSFLAGSVVLDSTGVANFANLAAGNYLLQAVSANDRGASLAENIIAAAAANVAAAAANPITLTIGQETKVTGTATDSSTGAAIKGALVMLTSTTDPSQQYTALTHSDGSYVLHNVLVGSYNIDVLAFAHQTLLESGVAVSGATDTVNFSLVPIPNVVYGFVYDVNGNPVVGAMVNLEDSAGDLLGQTTTDATGKYVIDGGGGSSLHINVTSYGISFDDLKTYNDPAGQTTPVHASNIIFPTPVVAADLKDLKTTLAAQAVFHPQAWFEGVISKTHVLLVLSPSDPGGQDLDECGDAYKALQKAIKSMQKAAFKVVVDAAKLVYKAQKAEAKFEPATDKFIKQIDTFAKDAYQLAASVFEEIGPSGVFFSGVKTLTNVITTLTGALTTLEAASDEKSLVAAFAQLDAARQNAATQVLSLTELWANLSGVIQTPGYQATVTKAIDSLTKAVVGFSSDPYATTRTAETAVNKAVDKLFTDGAKFFGKQADAQGKLQEYEDCISQTDDGDKDDDDTNPPKPPPGKKGPHGGGGAAGAQDPNNIIGPGGYGSANFVQPTGTWPFTVDFENDGTAAAQDVTVSQQLAPNLDWSTFQLGSFGFGTVNETIPAGLTQYQTTVAYQNVDGSSLNVQVTLDFNVQTGLLTATFTSLDPTTGQAPSGVFDGFLPPDNASGVGEGFVRYTVQPQSSLTTGATVNAAATVVFDTNAPLATKTITNTIDAGPPTSSVAALPASETATSFTVSWAGTDDVGGSGIAAYDVFVSDNGGPFTAFQTATTATSATFTGVNGHTYGFYSVATDNVGNRQPTPTAAQASTTVTVLPTSSVATLPATETSTSFTVSWSGSDTGGPGIATFDVFVSDNGGPFTAFQTATTAASATFNGVNGHTYGFYSV
ncbi:MAG TPA: carboxypeptidase regulatory-like domain-containing protein, partial [Pirellulales bacterium]|nr:carboxypeptidase regulatory-like domain-containing protein [Pirellulales bacterium]